MRSFSIFKMPGCGFIRTRRPWAIAWKRRRKRESRFTCSTGRIRLAEKSSKGRCSLTIGELAQLYNTENKIGADLHVIQMRNWHRNYFYESTGLRWVPPSPNLRTTKGAILYPGLEILQNAGISVGRGTEVPFEIFGAPWMN